jgi:hypothetical protein
MTPGRWMALLIGVPVALALIGWTGFSFIAQFGRASIGVYDTNLLVQHGQLSVNAGGGDVTVRPGQAARLAGTVTYSLVRPVISQNGSGINLRCRLVIDGGCDLAATLTVPPRTGLTLSTGGGNVSVSGVSGKVSVSTGGGDLTADDLASTLSFTTDGGNVNGTAVSSSGVTVVSGGGDVTLAFTRPPANLVINAYGGNVNVVLPHDSSGYDVTATTDGGNFNHSIDMNSLSPDKITIDSGGGDITLS